MYKKIRYSWVKMLLIFLITLFCFSSIYAQPAKEDAINTDTIFYVIKLLKQQYISDININQFLNNAVRGVNEYLKNSLKIKTDEMPLLNEKQDTKENIKIFSDNLQNVLYKYHDKISKSKLIYASLIKMLETLAKPPYKDPYTLVMTPKEFKLLNEQMSGGNFGGIGIYIQIDKKNNNRLTVIEPIENTPAFKSGIKTGDIILRINGEQTKGLDIDVAAQKIRGRIGTPVTLAIERNNKTRDYVIIRENIHVKSAAAKLINKKIGYIKLRYFGENTNLEFSEALKKIRERGASALILDLRNNGGGYIDASIDVCSRFLPRGSLIVSVINERTNYRQNYYSTGKELLNGIPIVILINEYSASASEITAGALQDTKKAVIMGEKSFGKASVQQLYEFKDGGAIKYTIAHYYTPNGKNINEIGIEPAIKVKMDPATLGRDDDLQLMTAVNYLINKYKIK